MNDEQEIHDQIEIKELKSHKVATVKEFYPIYLVIDVEANKTSPYHLASNFKEFGFGYEITEIQTRAETNALAGCLLKINGQFIPAELYFIDATPKNFVSLGHSAVGTKFLYCTTSITRYKNWNLKFEAGWKLEVHPYNSHGVAQEIYLLILGYKVFTKVLD